MDEIPLDAADEARRQETERDLAAGTRLLREMMSGQPRRTLRILAQCQHGDERMCWECYQAAIAAAVAAEREACAKVADDAAAETEPGDAHYIASRIRARGK